MGKECHCNRCKGREVQSSGGLPLGSASLRYRWLMHREDFKIFENMPTLVRTARRLVESQPTHWATSADMYLLYENPFPVRGEPVFKAWPIRDS